MLLTLPMTLSCPLLENLLRLLWTIPPIPLVILFVLFASLSAGQTTWWPLGQTVALSVRRRHLPSATNVENPNAREQSLDKNNKTTQKHVLKSFRLL